MLRKKKNTEICGDEKTNTKKQTNLTMQLEEINQKILRKDTNTIKMRQKNVAIVLIDNKKAYDMVLQS